MRTDRRIYQPNQLVRVSAELFAQDQLDGSDTLTVEIASPNGETTSIVLARADGSLTGEYSGTVRLSSIGNYQVQLLVDSAIVSKTGFRIEPAVSELSVLNQQVTGLKELSERTGGSYRSAQTPDEIWSSLPRGKWQQVGNAQLQPVWSGWLVPTVFGLSVAVLLTLEWTLRRRYRLE